MVSFCYVIYVSYKLIEKERTMYGQKIKKKRQDFHMSQEDLARELNITRQAISKWEMDKAQPTMANLRELSQVFDVDMAYFIGEDKREEEESPAVGIFWWMLYSAISFVFFALYYFAIMESVLELNPKEMPYLLITLYMIAATIAFPEAYKDEGHRLENLDYFLFSKLALPVFYVLSPFIVARGVIKKD